MSRISKPTYPAYCSSSRGKRTRLRISSWASSPEGSAQCRCMVLGQVVLSSSSARVGSGWTDSGESYDSRGLKKRARRATREVPIPPVLVRLIRDHIDEFGTTDDGRLFRAVRNGGLLSKEYGDVWKAARLSVLTEQEAKTPLAEVPYGLRAACVSLWLESGVSPAEVARRAGHSIAVLFRFYAKAIHGSEDRDNALIESRLL
ncbi:hypothetical protein K373_01660 [Streptomyces sp. DvalAA-21]|nr:hypothetical protein K373_01660 [Streptomyces sp. DvalAA-21]RAJ37837.1 hypothetical protein K351_01407 [Streptomyces sp. DpondAA-E10]RAJ51685.1 hypothetical protein K352_00803 [Streptomyces sp. DpondAA-A50]SCD49347.1 hypothetical protein GA0115235_10304 [Streptomyces sp. DpondAA-F4a]SCL90544.1 hypothetical protein SAMN04883147_103815 [Streptomyces sp. DpondAA-F4]